VPNGGVDDDITFPIIGAIGAGNSHGASDVLAAIGGSGANLGVSVLRVGGDDSILGMGGRCLSSGGFLRDGDDILGTCSGGGPDHIAIHDLPTPEAFTTAPPLCAYKESLVLRATAWLLFDL
jgi:hypothetical protein